MLRLPILNLTTWEIFMSTASGIVHGRAAPEVGQTANVAGRIGRRNTPQPMSTLTKVALYALGGLATGGATLGVIVVAVGLSLTAVGIAAAVAIIAMAIIFKILYKSNQADIPRAAPRAVEMDTKEFRGGGPPGSSSRSTPPPPPAPTPPGVLPPELQGQLTDVLNLKKGMLERLGNPPPAALPSSSRAPVALPSLSAPAAPRPPSTHSLLFQFLYAPKTALGQQNPKAFFDANPTLDVNEVDSAGRTVLFRALNASSETFKMEFILELFRRGARYRPDTTGITMAMIADQLKWSPCPGESIWVMIHHSVDNRYELIKYLTEIATGRTELPELWSTEASNSYRRIAANIVKDFILATQYNINEAIGAVVQITNTSRSPVTQIITEYLLEIPPEAAVELEREHKLLQANK